MGPGQDGSGSAQGPRSVQEQVLVYQSSLVPAGADGAW